METESIDHIINPLWIMIPVIIILIIVAGTIGYFIGKSKKNDRLSEVLENIFTNIENYVIVISIVVLVVSLLYSGSTGNVAFLSAVLNIFATIIFSWLLTKKSTKAEFKEKEEELALKSYRHINYIESAANSASKAIDQYAECNEESSNIKVILSSTKEQIKYIQGGINTCKMDWYDLLSEKEKQNHNSDNQSYDNSSSEFGILRVSISEPMNQEDA